MKRHHHPSDTTIALADGLTLGLAEFGDPAGSPVLWCHGGLSSRLDAASADSPARDCGVRLIAPDRPGIGLSTPQPGRTLLDWADVAANLADALGIGRFSVLGWSFGGPYAAVCGARLGTRVAHVGLIASAIPADWPEMLDDINSMDRRFTWLSGRAPIVARTAFRVMGTAAARAPKLFAKGAAIEEDPASARAIARDPKAFSAAIAEGLMQPQGVVEEYRVMAEPWGFDLREIEAPVTLWQGDDDRLLPASWVSRLAADIPRATLVERPGEGHFLAHDHWPEVLTAVRPG